MAAGSPTQTTNRGRFLTGSTMGHVVRMTLTGALGITFVFLVDAVNLFWVSRLGDEALIAALGFSFTLQFFSVSFGIGLMIATTALVSRAIGEGQRDRARRMAMSALVWAVLVQSLVALGVVVFRHELVALAGAEGQTAARAARYLAISVPSLPIMVVGLVASGTLRAEGDGRRAMMVTLSSGVFSLVVDPVLILYLGLGLDGAALSVVISRIVLATVALRFALGTYDLIARVDLAAALRHARPFAVIAAPAVIAQLAAPFGNFLVTALIAGFGDAAVAGWSVVARLTVLAFGGIFSLASAIGGIFGQNYGAGEMGRVRTTYRDALIFCAVYVSTTWAILVLASHAVIAGFGLGAEAAEVVRAFTHLGAGGFLFVGALFVTNAAFNSLGRPTWAAYLTWARDGLVLFPVAFGLGQIWGAPGVIWGQALASLLVGVAGVVIGRRFVTRLQPMVARKETDAYIRS